MSILSSAIQTLSQMAIQESGVDIPKETDADIADQLKSMLNNLPMLEARECVIVPQMIPIKESKRLGYYLIEMEDISRYMMTNIAVANELPDHLHSKLAIVIDEDSILDEVAALGNNIDSDYWTTRPKAGLGLPMVGKDQAPDESKLRKIANTKQLLDVLTGRYGIPLVRKNYNQIGLLASANIDEGTPVDESAGVNTTGKNAILNEKDKKDDKADDTVVKEETEPEEVLNEGRCNCGKDSCPICSVNKKNGPIKVRGKSQTVKEDTNMDPHAAYIQRIRDIASGKLDHELDNGF